MKRATRPSTMTPNDARTTSRAAAGASPRAGAGLAARTSSTAVLITFAYWVMCQLRASDADRPWKVLSALDGSCTPTLTHVFGLAPPAADRAPAPSPLPTLG